MTPPAWIYGQLVRVRAGLEAGISYLTRCFGLDRYLPMDHISVQSDLLRSILLRCYCYRDQ